MKVKNIYEEPKFELIQLQANDIITTSGNDKPFDGEDDELYIGL